ncbi:MAG: outer membrane protein assembly factor BamD [Desulfovibrionaceae bacterium]|jgi:outer membrane protein assembly factor BamD|nr:outer membrane protein assembly factor BamD [Desulfovibrionaceae bacterium]
MRHLTRLLILLLVLLQGGCGIIDYFFLPPPEDTAQELFETGRDSMQAKDFEKAAEYFGKLKDRYPFSPYAPQAELALGDAYFLGEQYPLAADAYKEFESLHPRHEQAAYVLYQIALSSLNSFKSIDRPQDMIEEALQYFHRLKETYPQSEYAKQADAHIATCRLRMAEHELYVADFYLKQERYQASWERYRFVLTNFQDLPGVTAYAAKRAEVAYLKFQEAKAQAELEAREGSWKEWFDWL